jgi:hypothetical protein
MKDMQEDIDQQRERLEEEYARLDDEYKDKERQLSS